MYSMVNIILKSGQLCLPESKCHKTEVDYSSLEEGRVIRVSPKTTAAHPFQQHVILPSYGGGVSVVLAGVLSLQLRVAVYPRIAMNVVQLHVTMAKD